ncbi:hypothetical protein AAU61_12580 [Desulfocarbo indianensis]|nr:hypothetical protein AAU61_12580 [Desulfocarbo indianensis]
MRRLIKSPWAARVALLLTLLVALATTVAKAEAAFIPSEESLSQAMAGRDAATVQRVLQNKMVQTRLQELGYSTQEIQDRLAQLSDADRHALATQLDNLAPAGDGVGLVIGVLIIILLIILILKLLDKRVVV